MKVLVFFVLLATIPLQAVQIETENAKTSLHHFDFKTENGQQRVEDINYDVEYVAENVGHSDEVSEKRVEFRGGYSFISADGYEYTVKYKANKNGFQPHVTARKLKTQSVVAS